MKKNLLLVALLMLVFLSCNKENNDNNNKPAETTVEQDKENITSAFNNVLDCAIAIRDGDVATALIEFANVSDGDFLSRDWMNELITEELSNVIDFYNIYNVEKRFDFAFYCGTYNWNIGTETWNKLNSPSDRIIINFPSSESATTNNCVFTIDSYYDSHITMEGEGYWAPTSMNANLKVKGNKMVNINIKNVEYIAGYYTMAKTMDIEIFADPFTLSIYAEQLSATKYMVKVSMINNGNCSFDLNTEVNIAHDNFENFDLDDDMRKATGIVSWGNISFHFTANMRYLIDHWDLTEAQINSYLDIDVYYNNANIGQLEYIEENNEGEEDFLIIYKDGTSEYLSKYYDKFWDDFVQAVETVTGQIF